MRGVTAPSATGPAVVSTCVITCGAIVSGEHGPERIAHHEVKVPMWESRPGNASSFIGTRATGCGCSDI